MESLKVVDQSKVVDYPKVENDAKEDGLVTRGLNRAVSAREERLRKQNQSSRAMY